MRVARARWRARCAVRRLTSLAAPFNALGDAGLRATVEALGIALTKVDTHCCGVVEAGSDALSAARAANPTIM